jgi:cell division protein FtsI/penicillin-binding protein 2
VEPNPARPGQGCIKVGGHVIKDTAPPGEYDFRKALIFSCNSYFITAGLRVGPERIIRLGQRLHFGERADLPTRQEVAGQFPTLKRLSSGWIDRNTANISIGQDPVWVTPLQVAVLTSAIANRGKVLWPRLVERIEPQDLAGGEQARFFACRPPRDELGVSKRTMDILHDAMLADTEDPEGTGRHVRDRDPLPGLRICAKTGTAQVQDLHNAKTGQTTWFASFAPYGAPRWAVVVMIEDGESGGTTCSPVAGQVYKALVESDRRGQPTTVARAQ